MTAKKTSLKKEVEEQHKLAKLKKEPVAFEYLPVDEGTQTISEANVNDNSDQQTPEGNIFDHEISPESLLDLGYVKKEEAELLQETIKEQGEQLDKYIEEIKILKEEWEKSDAGKEEVNSLKARILELEREPKARPVNLDELANSFSLEDLDKGLAFVKAKIKGF